MEALKQYLSINQKRISAEFAGNPPPYVYERSIKNLLKYLIELVTNAYELEKQELESWVNLAQIGARVKLIEPEFKIRQWGTRKWSELIEVGLDLGKLESD